jgi:hypothetical protein
MTKKAILLLIILRTKNKESIGEGTIHDSLRNHLRFVMGRRMIILTFLKPPQQQ